MQHEVYVAFSVHNTNTFITANKTVELSRKTGGVEIDGLKFKVGHSRTNSLRGAVKLLADDLMDGRNPTTDPVKVMSFFNKLKQLGWNVESQDFETKHADGLKAAAEAEAAKSEAPAEPSVEQTESHPEQVDDPKLPKIAADVPDNLEQSSPADPAESSPAPEGTGQAPE